MSITTCEAAIMTTDLSVSLNGAPRQEFCLGAIARGSGWTKVP